MTCFHCVSKVTLESVGGKKFVICSCCYREQVGTPCWHVLCVTCGEIDLPMIDVRWLKAFHVYYGEDSALCKPIWYVNYCIQGLLLQLSFSYIFLPITSWKRATSV